MLLVVIEVKEGLMFTGMLIGEIRVRLLVGEGVWIL